MFFGRANIGTQQAKMAWCWAQTIRTRAGLARGKVRMSYAASVQLQGSMSTIRMQDAEHSLVRVRLVWLDGLDLRVAWGVLLVPGLSLGTVHFILFYFQN